MRSVSLLWLAVVTALVLGSAPTSSSVHPKDTHSDGKVSELFIKTPPSNLLVDGPTPTRPVSVSSAASFGEEILKKNSRSSVIPHYASASGPASVSLADTASARRGRAKQKALKTVRVATVPEAIETLAYSIVVTLGLTFSMFFSVLSLLVSCRTYRSIRLAALLEHDVIPFRFIFSRPGCLYILQHARTQLFGGRPQPRRKFGFLESTNRGGWWWSWWSDHQRIEWTAEQSSGSASAAKSQGTRKKSSIGKGRQSVSEPSHHQLLSTGKQAAASTSTWQNLKRHSLPYVFRIGSWGKTLEADATPFAALADFAAPSSDRPQKPIQQKPRERTKSVVNLSAQPKSTAPTPLPGKSIKPTNSHGKERQSSFSLLSQADLKMRPVTIIEEESDVQSVKSMEHSASLPDNKDSVGPSAEMARQMSRTEADASRPPGDSAAISSAVRGSLLRRNTVGFAGTLPMNTKSGRCENEEIVYIPPSQRYVHTVASATGGTSVLNDEEETVKPPPGFSPKPRLSLQPHGSSDRMFELDDSYSQLQPGCQAFPMQTLESRPAVPRQNWRRSTHFASEIYAPLAEDARHSDAALIQSASESLWTPPLLSRWTFPGSSTTGEALRLDCDNFVGPDLDECGALASRNQLGSSVADLLRFGRPQSVPPSSVQPCFSQSTLTASPRSSDKHFNSGEEHEQTQGYVQEQETESLGPEQRQTMPFSRFSLFEGPLFPTRQSESPLASFLQDSKDVPAPRTYGSPFDSNDQQNIGTDNDGFNRWARGHGKKDGA